MAYYGLLVRDVTSGADEIWLRFVDGRPVSGISIEFVDWCCGKLELMGKKAFLMVWDNASWHISHEVCEWIRNHNRQVKVEGKGVRVVLCLLPIRSPWLNPIEPRWIHATQGG